MTDGPRPELPDLLTEELPEDVLDDSELFSADESADPLPPSHRTVAGLGEVRDALRDARRVYYYPTRASEDDKAPLKLSPQQAARQVIEHARNSPRSVIVAGQFVGSDLTLYTLEIMPQPRPRSKR